MDNPPGTMVSRAVSGIPAAIGRGVVGLNQFAADVLKAADPFSGIFPDSTWQKALDQSKAEGEATKQAIPPNPNRNIVGEVLDTVAESSVQSLPAMAGAGLAPTLATKALSVGVGSGAVEFFNAKRDYFAKAGVDLADSNAVAAAEADPQLNAAAEDFATRRAATVGALDTATLGASSRIGGTGPLRAAARVATEAAGGAAGEAGAQLATEGAVTDWKSVAMEAAGEVIPGAVEVAAARRAVDATAPAAPSPDMFADLDQPAAAPPAAAAAPPAAAVAPPAPEAAPAATPTPPAAPEAAAAPPAPAAQAADMFADLDTPAPAAPTVPPAMSPISTANPEANTESLLSSVQYPVQELPIGELKLSKDVPNFKEDARDDTGEVRGQELKGRYVRLGTAPVVVWERANGDREIITGRHRFALARRTGERTIPAQVVREADGFTRAQALVFDAEANIRDNQGTTRDYAHFFRNSGLSRAEADTRGLVSRSKGQQGAHLGYDASDDLYTLYRARKIAEPKAVAIARAAPGRADLQRVGMAAAIEDTTMSAEDLENYVSYLAANAPAPTPGMEQTDMFGADETFLQEAIATAKAVSKIRDGIQQRLNILKTGQRLTTGQRKEIARQVGVEIKTPQDIEAARTTLEAEADAWTRWKTDPAMIAAARQRAGLTTPARPPVAPPPAVIQQQAPPAVKAAAAIPAVKDSLTAPTAAPVSPDTQATILDPTIEAKLQFHDRLATTWEAQADQTRSTGKGAGAGNIDYRWRADAVRSMIRRIRSGEDPVAAAAATKAQAREWINEHNSRRNDKDWKRWEGSADKAIDDVVADVRSPEPAPPAVSGDRNLPAAAAPTSQQSGNLSRMRGSRQIVFDKPIQTPFGKITAYHWQSQMIEDTDASGEPIERRVSDWDKAALNEETGRMIVHHFAIQKPDGTQTVVSLETLGKSKPEGGTANIKKIILAARRLPVRRAELEMLEGQGKQYAERLRQAEARVRGEQPPAMELVSPSARKIYAGFYANKLESEGIKLAMIGNVEVKKVKAASEVTGSDIQRATEEWRRRRIQEELKGTELPSNQRMAELKRMIRKDEQVLKAGFASEAAAPPAQQSPTSDLRPTTSLDITTPGPGLASPGTAAGVGQLARMWTDLATAEGGLGRDVFRLREASEHLQSAMRLKASQNARRLKAEVRSMAGYGLTPDSLRARQAIKRQVNEAMTDPTGAAFASLPANLQPIARDMRNDIDQVSLLMIQEGLAAGPAAQTFMENLGTYLNRSYRIFNDKSYKPAQDAINRVTGLLRRQLPQQPGESSADYERRIMTNLDMLMSRGQDGPAIEEFNRRLVGMKNNGILKRRGDIPVEVRALWGEYTEADVNYLNTIGKMSNLLANHRFLNDTYRAGRGKFIFDDPAPGHVVPISAKGDPRMGALAGKFTNREFADALAEITNPEQQGPWLRAYMKLNGMVKLGKTVLDPAVQIRNFLANPLIILRNGHFPFGKGATAFRTLAAEILPSNVVGALQSRTGFDRQRWEQQFREYTALGVIDPGANAGEIRATMADALGGQMTLDEFVDSRAKKMLKLPFATLAKVYQSSDSFFKIINYHAELANLQRAYPNRPTAELQAEAAELTRQLTPTYGRVPGIVTAIRKFPLFGTFVSFPAEMLRTTANTIRRANYELRTPELRAMGKKRRAGIIAAHAIPGLAVFIARMATGTSDDDDEALRTLAAPWNKNASLLHLGPDEAGMPRFLNLSLLDPFYYKKAITAFMRDDLTDREKTVEALGEIFGPFVSEDILASSLMDIARNRNGATGNAIHPETATFDEAWQANLSHVWNKALSPGVVKRVQNIVRAVNGEVGKKSGKVFKVRDEITSALGIRVETLNAGQSIDFAIGRFAREKADAGRRFTSLASAQGDVPTAELAQALARTLAGRRDLYKRMASEAAAASKFGVNSDTFLAKAKANGLSKDDAAAILAGQIPDFELSKATLDRITTANPIRIGQIQAAIPMAWQILREMDNAR